MKNAVLLLLLLLLSLPLLAQRPGKRVHPSIDSLRTGLVVREVNQFNKELAVRIQNLKAAKGKQEIRAAAAKVRELCEAHEKEMELLAPSGKKNGKKAQEAVNYSLTAEGPAASILKSAAILNYFEATRKAYAAHLKDTERVAHLARRLEHERNMDKLPVLIERMEEWKKSAKVLEKQTEKKIKRR